MIKRIAIFFVLAVVAAAIYFAVTLRFTPGWVMGQELERGGNYTVITDEDLSQLPILQKFLNNFSKVSESEGNLAVLVRGTNGQGRRLKDFLEFRQQLQGGSSYPYYIKYRDRYFGLDIIYQFWKPEVY